MSLVLLFIAALLAACNAVVLPSAAERRAIAECLGSFGGITPENAERLQRYKEWSDTYEEFPCFTNCYLSKILDIYNETVGFDQENVIKQFGRPLFNACQHRMIHGRDRCELAYNGFHCLVSLENDPFILIESMENLNDAAKIAMKDCLHRFDQYEWDRVKEYSSFPVHEPIPCYTKCFLEKLQLYDVRTKQWNILNMRRTLGVPMPNADIYNCLNLAKRRNRNSCKWMYHEFTCFVKAKQ